MAAMIEPQDKAEGAHVAASDFFFARIGEPLPVEYAGEGGGGDARPYGPGHLPSQPLAVFERFWLVFVAHSSGFCVARTWSVMGSAEGIQEGWRGPSVRQLSIVDVPVGAVGLLSLSPDSSTLAATVGGTVYFFSVDSLQRGISSDSESLLLDHVVCLYEKMAKTLGPNSFSNYTPYLRRSLKKSRLFLVML